jgi:hypothetical protein
MQLQISSLEQFIDPEKETVSQVKTALAQRTRLSATRRLLPTVIRNQPSTQATVIINL